jgi:hypothetical protein
MARRPRALVTPAEVIQLQIQSGMMLAEANMVIAMRLWGMAGLWQTRPGENTRMVEEKTAAAQSSATAMTRAALTGKSPAAVALAGMKPIRAKTRANAATLSKRGPGTPG